MKDYAVIITPAAEKDLQEIFIYKATFQSVPNFLSKKQKVRGCTKPKNIIKNFIKLTAG